jgi:hypothetical protein
MLFCSVNIISILAFESSLLNLSLFFFRCHGAMLECVFHVFAGTLKITGATQ